MSSSDYQLQDISSCHLSRPGLGDRMFESVHNYGAPLSSISASPLQQSNDYSDKFIMSKDHAGRLNKFSYDSILNECKSSPSDLLMDKSRNGSSIRNTTTSAFSGGNNHGSGRFGSFALQGPTKFGTKACLDHL